MYARSTAVADTRNLPVRNAARQRSNGLRNRTGTDLSAFGMTLTLVFALATAAAHSDHPARWLFVGPAAITILFFAASLLHFGLLHISSKTNRSRSGRVMTRSEKSFLRGLHQTRARMLTDV